MIEFKPVKMVSIKLQKEWLEESRFCEWLENMTELKAVEGYYFIHDLFPRDSLFYLAENYLTEVVPQELKETILEIRKSGIYKTWFYR